MFLNPNKIVKGMLTIIFPHSGSKWKPTMTWSWACVCRAQKGTYLIDEKLQLDDSRATLMLAVTLYTSTAKAVLSLVKVKSVKH